MVRELESFVRDCSACILDRGHLIGDKYDDIVHEYRDRFETILGNKPKGLGERIKERIGVGQHHAPERVAVEQHYGTERIGAGQHTR